MKRRRPTNYLLFLLAVFLFGSGTQLAGQIFVENSTATGIAKYSLDGSPINTTLIPGIVPTGMTWDGNDYLYVANYHGRGIGKYTIRGDVINSTLISSPSYPMGVALDGKGYVYTVDDLYGIVGKYTTSGGIVNASLITGIPTGGFASIACDGDNIYLATSYVRTISKYTTSGALVTNNLIGMLPFNVGPNYLACDGKGHLFVARNDNRIGKYTTSGAAVNASFISSGLDQPFGLAIANGHIYVANARSDSSIAEYDSAGTPIHPSLIRGLPYTWGIVVIPSNHPPVVLCSNVTVSAASNCVGRASINNGSFDPDGDDITLVQLPPEPYPIGSNNVCLIVTDSHGASNVSCAVVLVVDTTPPTIRCPTNILVTNDPGQCSAIVSFSVEASDCAIADLSCDNPSGSVFPTGTTTVNCTATDASSNTISCAFTVTVRDNEAPLVTCRPAPNPSDKKISVPDKNPNSGQNPDGFYQLLAKDNCDSNPRIYVRDTGSSFVTGPFANGDIVKLIQNPGKTPSSYPGTPPIVANIHLNGDAMVYAADASENVSPDPCLVKMPPKPKAD